MSDLWLLLTIFVSAFAVAFSGAVPPGPMFAATVLHARSRGWSAGLLVSGGHALLELGLLAAILAGAAEALAHPAALKGIALAGGLFLVGIGVATLLARQPAGSLGAGDSPGAEPDSPTSPWRPFAAGIWTSVAQPLWPLWWALVGAGSVMAASRALGYAGVAAFYVGHVLADIVWFTLVAAAVKAGGRVLSEKGMRVLVAVCGAILVGSGVAFALGGALLF